MSPADMWAQSGANRVGDPLLGCRSGRVGAGAVSMLGLEVGYGEVSGNRRVAVDSAAVSALLGVTRRRDGGPVVDDRPSWLSLSGQWNAGRKRGAVDAI